MHTNWQFKLVSRFPENFPQTKLAGMNEESTTPNTKRSTKFGLGVFGGEFLFIGSLGRSCYNINNIHEKKITRF